MGDQGSEVSIPALTARQPRAIHSALTVLEAVAELGAGVSAREVSAHLGIPRATTYRLLNLLVEDEYLVRTPDLSGFALGTKVALLAALVRPSRVPTAARDILTRARASVRAGLHVVEFSDARMHIVDEDADFPLSDPVRLGREPERYALGLLMLVAADAAHPAAAAARAELADLGGIRQLDVVAPGYGCLAVPIRDAEGRVAGGLAYSGPRHRVVDAGGLVRELTPVARELAPFLT